MVLENSRMIQLKAIKKQFDQCVALDQISLDLEYGKTYGLWGRNGAGKTTLIRIVLGVLSPDHGTVRVFGNDPREDWSVRREIGIVSDEDVCFPELTEAERKRLQILNTPHKSSRAKLLKLADKISNLRSMRTDPPKTWDKARIEDYFEWAKQVADSCRGLNPELETLFDQAYSKK